MFEVYIYSGLYTDIIRQVLNMTAMLISFADFKYVPYVGGLIALMIFGVRFIFNQTFDPRWFIMGYIAWAALFMTTGDVIITDTSSGLAVERVSNVPAGVAIPASLVTGLSKSVSNLFQQSHSTLSSSVSGPISTMTALDTMMHLRKMTDGNELAHVVNRNYGNAYDNFRRYFNDCYLDAIDTDLTNSKATAVNDLIANNFELSKLDLRWPLGATIITDASGTRTLTCTAAYALIADQFDTSGTLVSDMMLEVYKSAAPNADPTLGSHFTEQTIEQIFNNWGTTSISTQKVMQNLVASELMRKTAEESSSSTSNLLVAKYLSDSREQEFIQTAANKEAWQQKLVQATVFIQALVFALFPLLALFIFFGESGSSAIKGYLKVYVWIALWAPVAIVLDTIIMMNVIATYDNMSYTTGAISATGEMQIGSWAHLNNLYKNASTWYSMGASMYVAIPALTWHLASGAFDGAVNAMGKIASSGASAGGVEGVAPTKGVSQFGDHRVSSSQASGWGPVAADVKPQGTLRGTQVQLETGKSLNTEHAITGAEEEIDNSIKEMSHSWGHEITSGESFREAVLSQYKSGNASKSQTSREVANGVKVGKDSALTKNDVKAVNANMAIGASLFQGKMGKTFSSMADKAADLPEGQKIDKSMRKSIGQEIKQIAQGKGGLIKNSAIGWLIKRHPVGMALTVLGSIAGNVLNNSGAGLSASAQDSAYASLNTSEIETLFDKDNITFDESLSSDGSESNAYEELSGDTSKSSMGDRISDLISDSSRYSDLVKESETYARSTKSSYAVDSYDVGLRVTTPAKASELKNNIEKFVGKSNLDTSSDAGFLHSLLSDKNGQTQASEQINLKLGRWVDGDKNQRRLASAIISTYKAGNHRVLEGNQSGYVQEEVLEKDNKVTNVDSASERLSEYIDGDHTRGIDEEDKSRIEEFREPGGLHEELSNPFTPIVSKAKVRNGKNKVEEHEIASAAKVEENAEAITPTDTVERKAETARAEQKLDDIVITEKSAVRVALDAVQSLSKDNDEPATSNNSELFSRNKRRRGGRNLPPQSEPSVTTSKSSNSQKKRRARVGTSKVRH